MSEDIQKRRPDVPLYWRIACRFWDDEESMNWPDDAKLAAIYFLTCRHRTLEGIYIIHVNYAAADLKWTISKVRRSIKFLKERCFLRYDESTNLLLIRNTLRYQTPETPNVVKGAIRRIKDLPDSSLLQEFLCLAKIHCYRKGAPPSAQAFYQELEQVLGQPPPQVSVQSSLLSISNLNPPTRPESKTKSETGPCPLGRPEEIPLSLERIEERKTSEGSRQLSENLKRIFSQHIDMDHQNLDSG
jgi:hypothetical protein